MTKKERIQLYTEAAACTVFGFFILKSAVEGGYLLYVTPRIKPWLIFTAAVMFLWSFSAFKSSAGIALSAFAGIGFCIAYSACTYAVAA